MSVDGIAEAVRVRFSHINDDTIAALGRPAQLVALPSAQALAA